MLTGAKKFICWPASILPDGNRSFYAMNWNWKTHLKMNSLKILAHMTIEYSFIGVWYIALEGDPQFWFYGIGTAIIVHLVIFTKLDFLHELHHHHRKDNKGHQNHDAHGQ